MLLLERKSSEHRELFYDADICVGCGICSDTCPTESLRLGPIVPIARKLIDMDCISLNKNNCVLCGLCTSSCPFGVLSLKIDGKLIKELNNYPKWNHESNINEDDCILCGKCSSACPRDAIFFTRTLPNINDLVTGSIEVDEDSCIYCNVCAEMCPADAIVLKSNSAVNEVPNKIEIDESKCVYCGVCKLACPENAMKAICTTCMNSEEITSPSITGDIFIEHKCINCGWCESVCPVDAVTITKPFDGEILRNPELVCKGDSCHACQDVCPCNAVEIVDNESKINPTFCTLCGACTKACPQDLLSVKRENMKLDNINSASWSEILGKLIG